MDLLGHRWALRVLSGQARRLAPDAAGRQVDTARVVSRTRTYSNAVPAITGVASLLIVGVVCAYKIHGPRRMLRGARSGPG